MKMTLEFEGTAEQLIQIAEYQSEGLDSHDLGDAMGDFLTEGMHEGGEFPCGSPEFPDLLVQCTIDFDSFSWEGVD